MPLTCCITCFSARPDKAPERPEDVSGSLTAFLGGTVSMSTDVNRTYQLRKFGSDSAQIWVDGSRVLSRAYSQFDASSQGQFTSFFGFGSIVQQNANSAVYDYVNYILGQATP